MEETMIVGKLDAIYFENPTNLYKVLRIEIDDELSQSLIADEVICTGQFATIHFDTLYEFYGKFVNHPKYGEQFAVSRYQQKAPTSEKGLIDYLSSNRFSGIGPVLAERIVDVLGMDAIDKIIEDDPRLKTVNGLTEKRRLSLRETILKYQGTERVFMQLSEWGFSAKYSDKIYQKYKSATIDKIKENPYELIETIEGIGFTKADLLAEKLGFGADSIERIMAGLYTAINEHCMNNGDTYLLEQEAIIKARALLEVARPFLISDELLALALDKALLEKRLIRLSEGIMLPSLYYAEIGIVENLFRHVQYAEIERFEPQIIEQTIDQIIELTGINYDEQQQAALALAIDSPMSIITGGPGTGKTTLVKGLIALHASLHEYSLEEIQDTLGVTPILLAAPTGRAAKRMNEMTGLPAKTIHRLIGYNREDDHEEFEVSEQLEGKLLIVDEMSMVDTWLMNWLIQVIPYGLQVIFVGDRDQLPSVGPGKVFADIIDSKVIPTIRLEKIYRQGLDSSIVTLAHDVRRGVLPQNFLEKQNDRSFIPCETNQVADVIQSIVEKAQAKAYNANNLQVLAPMYKGAAGINMLNAQLQAIMNPAMKGKRQIQYFKQIFRVGDKVLQLVNNAENDVYNGDIGKIIAIFTKEETESNSEEILVAFEEKELTYKRSEFDQLTLAYCCSIHKSQGSEYPLVILPLVDSYARMLRRDLLYTAITRAKERLVLVGNPQSFWKAANADVETRATFLKDLLQVKLNSVKPVDTSQEVEDSPQIVTLTDETIWTIDAMIGMENCSPYDFM